MKNTQDILMEFITFIKNEALGTNMEYKCIDILYDYKYKLFENLEKHPDLYRSGCSF